MLRNVNVTAWGGNNFLLIYTGWWYKHPVLYFRSRDTFWIVKGKLFKINKVIPLKNNNNILYHYSKETWLFPNFKSL